MHAPFGRLVCPSLIGYLRPAIFSKSKHLEPSPSTMTWSPRNYFFDIYRIYLPPKDLSPSLNSNSQLATRHLIRDLNPRHLIWNFPLNNSQRSKISDVRITTVQQRNTGDNIARLKQMPMRQRHLGARAYGDGEDVARIKRAAI